MRVTKLFSFSSNWLRKWREFSDQSQSWGRELCYHFRLGALFVLTYCIPSHFIRKYMMPSYQLPVSTPLESKLVWKRSWWGEEKRFVWSIQLFIDSFFFLFFLVLWPFVMYYSSSWTLVTKDFQVSLWKARGFFSKMKVPTCALTLISWLPCERLLQREGSNLRSNFRVQCFTKFYFQSKLLSYFNIMPIFYR